MKRGIISHISAIFLTFALIMQCAPLQVFALPIPTSLEVENVKTHISLCGTHYITYTLNGVDYDSRYTASKTNLKAFRNMSDRDKKKVSTLYYPGTERTEQFGEEGVKELCDCVNENTGYKQAWKVMHDRAQKWCEELKPFYGGVSAEDDPDRYYNQEYEKLTTLGENGQKLVSDGKYRDAPEAACFNEKYAMVQNLMKTGKTGYDNCVKCNERARDAAVKASSAWLIKFIVDNLIVPGTFAKPNISASGVDSALGTCYDQVLSMVGEITGTEAVSVTVEGNMSGLVIGEMAKKTASLKDGAAMVTYMRDLAEKNRRLAAYTHKQAVQFSSELEGEAAKVIAAVDARHKKEEDAKAEISMERAKKLAELKDANDTPADTSAYDYINKMDAYEQKAEWDKKAKELSADFESLYARILSDAETAAKKEGFSIISKADNLTYESCVRFEGNGGYHLYTGSDKYLLYYIINSEEELKSRKKAVDNAIAFNSACIITANTFSSDMDSIVSNHIDEYTDLIARKGGLDKVSGYYYNISKYYDIQTLLQNIVYISSVKTEVPSLEAENNELTETYKALAEDYRIRKEELKMHLEEYLNAQTNYHFAYAMYADVAKEQKDMAEKGLPDYVYTEQITISPSGYTLQADGRNTVLTAKINAAADKNKFFADEAEKLKKIRDQYDRVLRQKDIAYNYTKYWFNEIERITNTYWVSREIFEEYGIDPREMRPYSEIKSEFGGMRSNVNTFTDADTKKMLAANLLMHDFMGKGAYHTLFLERYNAMKAQAPYYKRKLHSGEISEYNFMYSYTSDLLTPYNVLNGSLAVPISYTRAYTGLCTENEKSFYAMLYGENGVLGEIVSAASNNYIPVESIKKAGVVPLSNEDITLAEGESANLSVVVEPAEATEQGIHWYSSNAEIADVDQNGKVTANGEGVVTIYAISEDAPIETLNDEDGKEYLDCPEEYMVSYIVKVSSNIKYDTLGNELNSGYTWRNYGTDSSPKYTNIQNDGGKTVVSAEFKAQNDGMTAILALYDADEKLIAMDMITNDEFNTSAQKLSAKTDKTPARAKIFIWLSMDDCLPYGEMLIDEKI